MFSVRTANFEALPTRNDEQDMRLSTSMSVAHVAKDSPSQTLMEPAKNSAAS